MVSLIEDTFYVRLLSCLVNITKSEGYTKYYSVEFKEVPANGSSFLASLYEVNIKGATELSYKETNLFVKDIIPDENVSILSTTQVNLLEIYAYAEILPIYEKLQEEASVPLNERYNTPKSYCGKYTNLIILENLTRRGFTSVNRMDVVTLEIAKLSIIELAKFHALSFVLEKKDTKYFNEKVKTIKYPVKYNSEYYAMISNGALSSMKYLDVKYQRIVEKMMPTLLKNMKKHILDSESSICLCHGDYRITNIMMKNQNSSNVMKIVPIDYQLIHYGSPVIDFLYFIYGSTDAKFRAKHLDDLKELYHGTMANFLNYFNMDIENHFSNATFQKVYREKIEYGLAVTLFITPIVLADDNEVDFTKLSHSERPKPNDQIRHRMEDGIKEFIEMGLL